MTINVKRLIPILLIYCTFSLNAQYDKLTTFAQSFTGDINIDGRLDDAAWDGAPITTGFTENEPEPNTAPSQKTEVKILYNQQGLYFGAYMHDTEPDKILKELSVRDRRNNTDWFGITLDTYQDGLNGFSFIVTAGGVQQDLKFAGGDDDSNWDAVWNSAVMIHDGGWTAEIFIPYSAIRFPNAEVQHWNLQLGRELRRTRESFFWNPIDPNFEGFVNQCGHLEGIKNIKSPVRLSVTPYVTGYLQNVRDGGISSYGKSYNGGMDLKYGINDAFTLDMTLVPDFGQVQSDNQVLNLSPFEVFFEENRQFFTEGLELFDRGNLFYTRRVGGRPIEFFSPYLQRQANEIVEDNPSRVQLYNASKISGRTTSGTGIGFFNAVAGETFATLRNTESNATRQIKTSPLTNYNVMVVDQNLRNNSRVSIINTNVMREGRYYDANTTGAFFNLRNSSQAYGLIGKVVRSQQFLESSTNSGHSFLIRGEKTSGVIKAGLGYLEESDTYNTNDLGFLFSPNERTVEGGIAYNQPNNKGKLQRYEIYVNSAYSRLYAPSEFTNFRINAGTFFIFKSRNAFGSNMRIEPVDNFDFFEPRDNFNSYLRLPKSWSVDGFFSSDYRKTFALDFRYFYKKFNQEGRQNYEFVFSPRLRVSDKLSFFHTTVIGHASNDLGFTSRSIVSDELLNIDPSDILIGRRNQDIIENTLTANYIFTNRQSLSLRLRQYNAQVEYNRFGVLDEAGNQDPIAFNGDTETTERVFDRNFNALNVDMNYIWRFAPGSDIIINFQSRITGEDRELERSFSQNISSLRNQFNENSLSLRVVYFLDYLYLKKTD